MVQKILILAANPKNTPYLRLDQELREIDEGLRRSRNRELFVIEKRLAVRTEDLRRALLDEDPCFVHFCGHGQGKNGILLEDMSGYPQLVEAESLANLFKLFSRQIECVVLNACYSEFQAEAISQHINYVIGMKQAIGDQAAIKFATGFYDAIGAGRTIEDAFEFGRNAVELDGVARKLMPILKKKTLNSLKRSDSLRKKSDPPELRTLSRSTSWIDHDDLKSEKNIDYTKLQNFLAAQNWKQADLETQRKLHEALGIHPWIGADYSMEDIENIPFLDIVTIDRLWVKYSNGRFGFSIQEKIYYNCLIGEQTQKAFAEAWDKWIVKVGWYGENAKRPAHHIIRMGRKALFLDSQWIDLDEIEYKFPVPGHLPAYWTLGKMGDSLERLANIWLRLESYYKT